MKWPAAITLAPMMIARRLPKYRSAIAPPITGVKYAQAVYTP